MYSNYLQASKVVHQKIVFKWIQGVDPVLGATGSTQKNMRDYTAFKEFLRHYLSEWNTYIQTTEYSRIWEMPWTDSAHSYHGSLEEGTSLWIPLTEHFPSQPTVISIRLHGSKSSIIFYCCRYPSAWGLTVGENKCQVFSPAGPR